MNHDLISKAIVLLVSYREYTGDFRMANLCGEIIEELKAELAKPETPEDLLRQSEIEGWRWAKECEAEIRRLQKLAKPEQEPVGIVQRTSIAGHPMADSTGVEWLTTVSSGTRLYASQPVPADNSAKTVKQLHPHWDMVAPLVERVNELERELHEYKKQKNLDTLKECVQKSDESIYEMQKLGQELDKLLQAKNHG
jgi:hypothetical protein